MWVALWKLCEALDMCFLDTNWDVRGYLRQNFNNRQVNRVPSIPVTGARQLKLVEQKKSELCNKLEGVKSLVADADVC